MPVKPATGQHPFSKPMIVFGVKRPPYSPAKPAQENEPSTGEDGTSPNSSLPVDRG